MSLLLTLILAGQKYFLLLWNVAVVVETSRPRPRSGYGKFAVSCRSTNPPRIIAGPALLGHSWPKTNATIRQFLPFNLPTPAVALNSKDGRRTSTFGVRVRVFEVGIDCATS